jgi:micrococcal nuclease
VKRWLWILTGLAVTVLPVIWDLTRPPDATPTHIPPRVLAIVTRVVDGDTFHADHRGRYVDVRLIGVHTPETVAPGKPIECFGPEASAFTESTLEGQRVWLEFDADRTDPYGRTLAYVWVRVEAPDGTARAALFNRQLVADGYATVETVPPDTRYASRFEAAERYAREHNLGLWGAC